MTVAAFAAETNSSHEAREFAQWVEDFKTSAKGPFKQIRWYCRDGSILPPGENVCTGHGGGIQHGEWNEKVLRMREAGYFIGNVLAAVDASGLVDADAGREIVRQILLERYLIAADDGWIFRGARYYRGALQIEDELAGARRLLVAVARAGRGQPRDYVLLRTAAKLLAHGEETADLARVRNLSSQLGEQDPGFEKLRNKIHSQPDAGDAGRVRQYLQQAPSQLQPDYALLASAIDAVFRAEKLDARLAAVARSLPARRVADEFHRARGVFRDEIAATLRLHAAARLLKLLRDETPNLASAVQWLDVLDASLALEQQVFTAGAELRNQLSGMTRQQRLELIGQLAMALYGTGELSLRQWQSVQAALARLEHSDVSLAEYREQLQYLGRVNQWVERWYRFHFAQSVQHLAAIEPKISRFVPEQLRGGPVLHFSSILDGLLSDANRLARVEHWIFARTTGSGMRMLNPGLARGVLKLAGAAGGWTAGRSGLQENGIYVLPETTAELTPVAGIMTLGEGNALSHVQILARNLGIPNIVIEQSLLPVLRPYAGRNIVMAVSPAGRVVLEQDGPQWESVFGTSTPRTEDRLSVDTDKLDLSFQQILTLDEIRARDAGRIAGPKAANLGELRHQFPHSVPQGIVIPFGVFHALLQQPVADGQQSVFGWMQARYRQLGTLQGAAFEQQRDDFLRELQQWILHSDPGSEFRAQLREALQQQFGSDTDYTLFVRSDTNMEDLPGFTGAGLNLTVPNVKGFEALLTALKQVWASPFTKRAFAWRQQRMLAPQHVYVSVLLMPSVAVEKSGVMVTSDITHDKPGWVTIAANEGFGGAVQGQAAEELRLHLASGDVQLLAEATAPLRRVLGDNGGISSVPVSGRQRVLSADEIQQLRRLADTLPRRFPMYDEQGSPTAVDVEFGYHQGKLVLFQARPYLASRQAMQSQYLRELDRGLRATADHRVRLDAVPLE
ncbi:MAG: PEP/pyruvate-binding domain-containing protein [Granulosicoccaceae bacterium]|jgi:hypothetical protein